MLKLYSFTQSSASYRVRIVLALKGVEVEIIPISLIDNIHLTTEYKAINPQQRVPFLVDGETNIAQSLAIIDYLEEMYPNPSIYPENMGERAKCRAFAHVIASDIFPLQNLGLRRKLTNDFGLDEIGQAEWCAYWISKGFTALEAELEAQNKSVINTGFLFGDYPTLADICLVPQMRNARRYGVELAKFPRLVEYDAKAAAHLAFKVSAPEMQGFK